MHYQRSRQWTPFSGVSIVDIKQVHVSLVLYLRACVFDILVYLIYFTFVKLNSKNLYIVKFDFYLEAYLEPTCTSIMEPFFIKITARSRWLFLQKSSIIDVHEVYKYTSGVFKLNPLSFTPNLSLSSAI